MSEELDRRVAEEVMREPEPNYDPPENAVMRGTGILTDGYFSGGENWEALDLYPEGATWKPVRFSSNLNLAMRAERKARELGLLTRKLNVAMPKTDEEKWVVYPTMSKEEGVGSSFPEALCNLLLLLVKEQ